MGSFYCDVSASKHFCLMKTTILWQRRPVFLYTFSKLSIQGCWRSVGTLLWALAEYLNCRCKIPPVTQAPVVAVKMTADTLSRKPAAHVSERLHLSWFVSSALSHSRQQETHRMFNWSRVCAEEKYKLALNLFRNQNLHNTETYSQPWVVSVCPVFVLLEQGAAVFNHSRGETLSWMGSV